MFHLCAHACPFRETTRDETTLGSEPNACAWVNQKPKPKAQPLEISIIPVSGSHT